MMIGSSFSFDFAENVAELSRTRLDGLCAFQGFEKKENEYTVTTNLAYLLEILNETSNMISTQQTAKLNSINFLLVASGNRYD